MLLSSDSYSSTVKLWVSINLLITLFIIWSPFGLAKLRRYGSYCRAREASPLQGFIAGSRSFAPTGFIVGYVHIRPYGLGFRPYEFNTLQSLSRGLLGHYNQDILTAFPRECYLSRLSYPFHQSSQLHQTLFPYQLY